MPTAPRNPGSPPSDPARTLYLVDISSFIFRAYYAIRPLHTRAKEPVNAVYGVAQMLARLAEEAQPRYLAIVYDSKEPSFRKEIYAEYKANRSAPPDDLIPQFDRIEQLIRAFGMPSYRQSGVEADDLIATLTRRWSALSPENEVVVVSGDKDLMQLVGERVRIWDTMKGVVYGPAEVEEKFGVSPGQIRDYLALVGDSSDNIPGVPGIGPKGAAELLKRHGTLEAALRAAAEGKLEGKKGEALSSHEEEALLSARLATVREDLPIEVEPDRLQYRFHVTEDCARLLVELDFQTLLNRWTAENKTHLSPPHIVSHRHPGDAPDPAEAASGPSAPVRSVEFRTVCTQAELEGLVGQIERKREFGFDLETTSLNPRQAAIVGIAICVEDSASWYIPIGHCQKGQKDQDAPAQLERAYVLGKLKPFLEDPRYKKIGQNLKYDWAVLMEQGFQPDGIGADTMIAAYVLEPEGRHNLKALSDEYLDYPVTTYEDVCGKGKEQIGFEEVPIDVATRYSAEDAWCALALWEKLRPRLQEERLTEIFARVDLPLVGVLARMEAQGVCIDADYLSQLSRELEKEARAIETRIQAFTSGPVNLNSPKQLAQLLFEELKLPVQSKTKTGYSTDAQVLLALSDLHEVPRLLLEYREVSKLKGTYVDPLPLMRDPKTGKIHASFHQTVAATGRLSSSDPNLQNIPIRTDRGLKIRRAFVPCPGNLLVSVDYSQIELRLLAHMSGDPELVRAFREDEDVHSRTAGELFGVAPEQVTERQRGVAKAINFGLMYGKTAFGLAQELRIPRKEASEIIQRYFERYAAVKKFLDAQIEQARERGFVCTLLGRKRHLPDIRARNPALRANAERMAMNTPIQGSAADLMKLAMIEIDQELMSGKWGSRLIIQVHDEVVLDCPEAEAERARKRVSEIMEGAMDAVMKIDVPLRVNSGMGASWMDL